MRGTEITNHRLLEEIEVLTLSTPSSSSIQRVALNERTLYAVDSEKRLLGWNFDKLPSDSRKIDLPPLEMELRTSALSLAATPDRLLVGHIAEESCIRVFDISESLNPLPDRMIVADSGSVFDLKVTSDEIIAGLGDGMLKIWSLDDFRLLHSMKAQEHFVLCVSADSEFAYGGGADRYTNVYQKQDWNQIAALEGHDASVFCLEDGRRFVYSGSGELWWGGPGSPRPPRFESAIRVWSKDDWSCVAVLEGHQDNVNAVCADSSFVFSISDDSTIRTYSIGDWESVSYLDFEQARPTSACQDAHNLYVGCSDGVVRRIAKRDLI